MTMPRLAYDEFDSTREMTRDAVACRGERHLAAAVTAPDGRRPVSARAATTTTTAGTPRVSPAAASFAARLFD